MNLFYVNFFYCFHDYSEVELSVLLLLKMKIMEGVKEITKKGAKFMDGQEKEFDSIIFATGYKSNVPTWLQVSLTSIIPTHLNLILNNHNNYN